VKKLILQFLVVATLANFSNASLSFADAGNCACPNTDSLSKPKCGPIAEKLKTSADKVDPLCAPTLSHSWSQSVLFIKSAKKAYSEVKSPDEVLNYMNCYRPEKDERFCHYKKTLAPIIELAAESSRLPFAVQACLFRQESDFSPTARNKKSGALGYIQFMDGTEDDVNPIIQGTQAKFTAQIQSAEAGIKKYKKLVAQAKTTKTRLSMKRQLNTAIALRAIAKGHLEARKVWERYWEGTKNIPKSVKFEDSKCQNLAIIMSSVKQVYDLYLMQWKGIDLEEGGDGGREVNGMSATDSAIFLAGGYNLGIYSFSKKCSETRSIQACEKKFPEGHETRKHMAAIDRCARKDSWKPLSGRDSDQKDCTKSRCLSWEN
jgi:hypothetical protein